MEIEFIIVNYVWFLAIATALLVAALRSKTTQKRVFFWLSSVASGSAGFIGMVYYYAFVGHL